MGGFDTVGLIMVRQILFDVAIAESITQIPAGSDQYNVCLEVAALEWILHVVTSLIEDDVKRDYPFKIFLHHSRLIDQQRDLLIAAGPSVFVRCNISANYGQLFLPYDVSS